MGPREAALSLLHPVLGKDDATQVKVPGFRLVSRVGPAEIRRRGGMERQSVMSA